MFGKYIPCRDAAITKLDAKDIMHDPSAYRLLACLSVCMDDADGLSIFIHELLAWLEVEYRVEKKILLSLVTHVRSRLMGCALAAWVSGQKEGGKIQTCINFFARPCTRPVLFSDKGKCI